MQNPYGIECPYFYGDYYRGREQETCRLLGDDWEPELCQGCPAPGIRQANACEHLALLPHLKRDWRRRLRRTVTVRAYCRKSARDVPHPEIGCGECHTLPEIFVLPDDDHPAA